MHTAWIRLIKYNRPNKGFTSIPEHQKAGKEQTTVSMQEFLNAKSFAKKMDFIEIAGRVIVDMRTGQTAKE